jgi:hypothetical protein
MDLPIERSTVNCLTIALLPLAACMPKPETKIVDTSCDWVKPIFVRKADKLTTQTAGEILAHDDKWKEICGDKK